MARVPVQTEVSGDIPVRPTRPASNVPQQVRGVTAEAFGGGAGLANVGRAFEGIADERIAAQERLQSRVDSAFRLRNLDQYKREVTKVISDERLTGEAFATPNSVSAVRAQLQSLADAANQRALDAGGLPGNAVRSGELISRAFSAFEAAVVEEGLAENKKLGEQSFTSHLSTQGALIGRDPNAFEDVLAETFDHINQEFADQQMPSETEDFKRRAAEQYATEVVDYYYTARDYPAARKALRDANIGGRINPNKARELRTKILVGEVEFKRHLATTALELENFEKELNLKTAAEIEIEKVRIAGRLKVGGAKNKLDKQAVLDKVEVDKAATGLLAKAKTDAAKEKVSTDTQKKKDEIEARLSAKFEEIDAQVGADLETKQAAIDAQLKADIELSQKTQTSLKRLQDEAEVKRKGTLIANRDNQSAIMRAAGLTDLGLEGAPLFRDGTEENIEGGAQGLPAMRDVVGLWKGSRALLAAGETSAANAMLRQAQFIINNNSGIQFQKQMDELISPEISIALGVPLGTTYRAIAALTLPSAEESAENLSEARAKGVARIKARRQLAFIDQAQDSITTFLGLIEDDPTIVGAMGSIRAAGQTAVEVLSDLGLGTVIDRARSIALTDSDVTEEQFTNWFSNPALSTLKVFENSVGIILARIRVEDNRIPVAVINLSIGDVKLTGATGSVQVVRRLNFVFNMLGARKDKIKEIFTQKAGTFEQEGAPVPDSKPKLPTFRIENGKLIKAD